MNLNKGFSLIELLVVIAIIGILAGIAFPVFSRAKDSAYRSSDMSKMNELRTALQLYRTDQGAYPPALLGYATSYWGGDTNFPGNPNTGAGNIVPANQALSALFPKRVQSLVTFQPSYNRQTTAGFNSEVITAVWPSGEGMSGDAGQSAQRYGPTQQVLRCAPMNQDGSDPQPIPSAFYKLSGFDAATVELGSGAKRNELRYSLFFTGWTVAANPCAPTADEQGSASDDPRQLGYADPPDTTVVTWNSFFREYQSDGTPVRTKRDIVLFLGGSAKMMDSRDVADRAWKVNP